MQRAGDLELVLVERRDRLRGQQGQGIDADRDRDIERLAVPFGGSVELAEVARQNQDAQLVRALELQPVDRDVLAAGFGIARDHQPGGDVGAGVELMMGRQRQQFLQIDRVAVRHLLAGSTAGGDLAPRQRLVGGVAIARQQRAFLDAHRLRDPGARAEHA